MMFGGEGWQAVRAALCGVTAARIDVFHIGWQEAEGKHEERVREGRRLEALVPREGEAEEGKKF